jgi:hypothetical protein
MLKASRTNDDIILNRKPGNERTIATSSAPEKEDRMVMSVCKADNDSVA